MLSEIQKFYKNQTIFITGGTGLVGKLIIEKLLRACFDLKRIYLLVRPKKDKTAEERFVDFFNYPCFDLLKEQRPDFQSKVGLIIGDCGQPNLGISPDDWELLTKAVTCIFHAAANVRFDEPLRSAAKTNVFSTQQVLKLAENAHSIKIFVHISTAYTHCPREYIEECFYKSPIQPNTLLTLVDGVSDEVLDKITPNLLGDWPNTYCYTKAVSEELVREASKKLPIVLIRPSIIVGALYEPMPGWIEKFYGAIGLLVGICLGVIKTLLANNSASCQFVPCDYVANATIVTAWDYYHGSVENQYKTKIYNFTMSNDHYVSWKECFETVAKAIWDYPLLKTITYPNFQSTSNRYYYKIRRFFWHTCMAYFVDFILRIMGREAIAVKSYKRLDKLVDSNEFFGTCLWMFERNNVRDMWQRLSEFDKKLFQFDMDTADLKQFVSTGIISVHKYLMKEGPETIEPANRRLYKLMVIHYCFIGFLFLIAYFIISIILKMLVLSNDYLKYS